MKTYVILLLAATTAMADGGGLNEKYTAWKYAIEVQAKNGETFARPGEIVDVGLAIPTDRAANLKGDLRVVQKRGFDLLLREIPAQIYGLKTSGDRTEFRVIFKADFQPSSTERFAVFYDNPKALPDEGQPGIGIQQAPQALSLETPFYSVKIDPATGQCMALESRIPGNQPIYRGGGFFPLPVVTVPSGSGDMAQPTGLEAARAPGHPDQVIVGPVFSEIKGSRELVAAHGDAVARVKFVYLFLKDERYFVVKSSLHFLKDTPVYAVELNRFAADQAELTHYFFRPYTPSFRPTEIEEVGSIMVDAGTRKGLPNADLLAGMLPVDLAWHAVGNIDKGFSVTAFNLSSHSSGTNSPVPNYRPATRARVRSGLVELSNAPICVGTQKGALNTVSVPKGTVFEEAQAISFSDWNNGGWRSVTDQLGRQLNTALEITVYPQTYRTVGQLPVLPHHGERGGAYERSGIR